MKTNLRTCLAMLAPILMLLALAPAAHAGPSARCELSGTMTYESKPSGAVSVSVVDGDADCSGQGRGFVGSGGRFSLDGELRESACGAAKGTASFVMSMARMVAFSQPSHETLEAQVNLSLSGLGATFAGEGRIDHSEPARANAVGKLSQPLRCASAGSVPFNGNVLVTEARGSGGSEGPGSESAEIECSDVRRGTPGADRLAGNGGSERLEGLAGADLLIGRGGDDCLFGNRGRDRLRGGPGGDALIGAGGADTIVGGAGRDEILSAGDGSIDRVRCGSGRDRAVVDRRDRVRGCEQVSYR